MKRILSVKVRREMDTSPDLSWLGEYASTPGDGYAIDRKERGDQERGTYRYFRTSGNYKGEPQADIEKYTEQDYKRMEAFNSCQWCMVGVFAEAEIVLTDVAQTIHSGGLWGIESDSDDAYFTEVEETELEGLRTQLKEIGFTKRQIDAAFAKKESVQA